ncbi:DUF6293 family protein [Nanoarchaeota archaeon]
MDKKYIMIVPVGENVDSVFVGLREFPTDRIVLITCAECGGDVSGLIKDLEKFKVPVKVNQIKGMDLWEGMFKAVKDIADFENKDDLIINITASNRIVQCASTSAAFVNGIKAFGVLDGKVILLPILKFSYYNQLSDKKMNILSMLDKKDCCASLEELRKKTKMSLPLISYHINGTRKVPGLKELGLVETHELKGRIIATLTTMARMLLRGLVKQKED